LSDHRQLGLTVEFQKIKVEIKTLSHFKGELPKYQTPGSSGMDVRAAISEPILLKTLERRLIPTGLSVAVPVGFELQVRPRSGLALKHGISMVNTPGTVDSDYRGEVGVILINLSAEDFTINPGERIAQLVFAPIVQAEFAVVFELPSTGRGAGGFGSTGR